MLFVPGGWASNKSRALGERGIKAIQDFVAEGGSYLGFCGGAGLATMAKGGLGLLNVKRRPTKERVPSYSGRIELNLAPHEIWGSRDTARTQRTTTDGPRSTAFNAWWPSQLIVDDNDVTVLATYGDALPDSFSSDLNVGDVQAHGSWDELEKIYKINLNPGRLKDEPAVIEGTYGKGKVILSLVHFDTPDDKSGQQVLINLWEYLAGQTSAISSQQSAVRQKQRVDAGAIHELPLHLICSDLIALGERNFLWFWRNSMLLQWRRGVRGLEYNTLYIMTKEISVILQERKTGMSLEKVKELLVPFIEKAKKLLALERHALQKGTITYERCDDREIQDVRKELFSESKSHGGMFKEVVDEIDGFLYVLLSGH